MQIRRKTEKPMVIHTKQKTQIHAKGKQETGTMKIRCARIKGRNVLTVTRAPNLTRREKAQYVHGRTRADSLLPAKRNSAVASGRAGSIPEKSSYPGGIRKSVRKNRTGHSGISMAGVANAKIALDQMEGGGELYDACMTAGMLTKPARSTVKSAPRAGRRIKKTSPDSRASVEEDTAGLPVHVTDIPVRSKTAECQQASEVPQKTLNDFRQSYKLKNMDNSHHIHNASTMQAHKKETDVFLHNKIRPVENAAIKNTGEAAGENLEKNAKKNLKSAARKPARKAQGTVKKSAKKASEETAKKVTKEAVKQSVRVTASAAGTAAGTATAGVGGALTGIVAGEAAGIKLDRHDMEVSTKKRMMQLYLAKLRQEENQDSIVKALKDIVIMRFSIAVKYATKYTALFLAGAFLMAAFMAVPVISVLAVIYNSPLAVLFPSISSAETTQEVLSTYVAEFNGDIEDEMGKADGYDKVKKLYVGYGGDGVPDNFCDILAVYMVRHGIGDTATDMTDKAKRNLKKVFGDMCSYSTSCKTETGTDENGNEVDYKVKYVNITLKTCSDMAAVYGFNTEEQELLAELMKPEYTASLGGRSPSGGQEPDPDRYRAAVDSVSDSNGKKVLEFALSKVGYPYSQEHRDDGAHFDCSSLAYYAWRHAGVSIAYQGSTSAAYEGKLCYDNGWLVHYGEMQPGDLIFFSFESNGRFMDISHVAVYAGDGMIVEAANKRLGVVYRPIHSRSSIVLIGRPR